MPGNSVIYVDHSRVLEGKLDALKASMTELAAFVEAQEPRIRSYDVFFTSDGARMTVINQHDDVESLEFHLTVGGPRFKPIGAFIRLLSIDVYGPVSDAAFGQLQQKAEMLGPAPVTVHERGAGFERR